MKPELKVSRGGSAFQKIAMGSWRTAGDPFVYGLIELDMTKALAFIKAQDTKGTRLSITHQSVDALKWVPWMAIRPVLNISI